MMNDEMWEAVGAAVAIVIPVLLTVLLMGGTINYINYVSASAEYEQLRTDLQDVNMAESEDVMGQVTQANQTIMSWRRWNSVPFVCLVVPNGWERIKPITVKRGEQ